jgi:hypothetical protein
MTIQSKTREPKLKTNYQTAARHEGILFVSVTAGGETNSAGDDSYAPLVADTTKLLDRALQDELTKVPALKVSVGDNAIEVHKFNGCYVAVAFMAGHSVVKSIQRTIKKLGRSVANKAEAQPEPRKVGFTLPTGPADPEAARFEEPAF